MEKTNTFKNACTKKCKQRNTLLIIAMVISCLYTLVPLYLMLFGMMTKGLAAFMSIPACIAFCMTLYINGNE